MADVLNVVNPMKLSIFSRTPLLTHFAIILAAFCPLSLFSQSHPRLLVDGVEVAGLRDKVTREPFASMVTELEGYAESDDTVGTEYGQTVSAVNCAFLYLLTGDDTWAAKARDYVEQRIEDTGSSNGWDRNIKGLALYWHGRGVALAYDFCFDAPSWNTLNDAGVAIFVDYVEAKLKAQADRIYEDGGTQQNRNPASNWQNNRFASAGLIYLAIEETLTEAEKARIDGCMDKVRTYLVKNMGDSPDSRGYNIEAIGYQMYPWSFTGPFAIAAERMGYGRMADAAPAAAAYALWNVYSVAARIPHVWGDHYGIHPDFGDDNNNHRGEGCYGLAFYFCPEFLHPGLRYWYDRLVGELGDQTWDRERHGLMYSILYYNDTVAPEDPDTIKEWTNAFLETGGNGYFTFRNRYQDGDDMLAQIYAKFRGNAGHSGPDALSFRIVGLEAPFAVGGGRYGPDIYAEDTGAKQDAYLRSMNTLYPVDPDYELDINGNSGRLVGVPQLFPDGGGSVTLEIAANNVGTSDHTRRFLADYSPASGAEAVYVISDTSEDGVFWQFCQVDLDSGVQAITASGNTFTVSNPNGTSLKGTVIYPTGDLQWETGSRIRGSNYGYLGESFGSNEYVHFQSAAGDYLVVLTVVDVGGTHPAVTAVSGSGANDGRIVDIGGLTVAIDGDHISRDATIQQPPSVVVNTPAPLTTLAPAPSDLNVDGRAFPGSANLAELEVYYGAVGEYIGDGFLDTVTGEFSFTIPDLELGHHLLRVKAVDSNGLSRYSEYIPVSVHVSQPPAVEIASPQDGAILPSGGLVDVLVDAVDPDVPGGITGMEILINGASQAVSGSGPWTAQLDSSQPGGYRIEAIATDTSGESASAVSEVHVSLGQLPAPWIHFDVGAVAASGSASLSGDVLTLAGSGNDIWNEADEFHYAFQPFTGNGEIITHVTSQTNTNSWAKAGPMFRASSAAGSANVGLFITPGNGVTLQRRDGEGVSSSSTRVEGINTPVWLRLVRSGDSFTGYYRAGESEPWQLVGTQTVDLEDAVLAGLAGTSHNDGSLMTAVFESIDIAGESAEPPTMGIHSNGGGGLAASWFGKAGETYQMEVSTNLNSWAPLGLEADGGDAIIEHDLSGFNGPFFLRTVITDSE